MGHAKRPTSFLEIRARELDPSLIGLCAGYELNNWRAKQLAAHLIQWLPEFALTPFEVEALGAHNAVELIARAAQAVYATKKTARRGEIGEILLHAAVRQTIDTVPAISKIYYKDGANETVKGFDAVHVVATQQALELWLGEVKFYKAIGRAINDVIREIDIHTKRDYLRAEFAAITNKIDPAWPHASRLRKLLHKNTSLDEVFDVLRIPVLLTYESPVVAGHSSVSSAYVGAFEKEIKKHGAVFRSRLTSKVPLRVELFLLPLKTKRELVDEFDRRLRGAQELT